MESSLGRTLTPGHLVAPPLVESLAANTSNMQLEVTKVRDEL